MAAVVALASVRGKTAFCTVVLETLFESSIIGVKGFSFRPESNELKLAVCYGTMGISLISLSWFNIFCKFIDCFNKSIWDYFMPLTDVIGLDIILMLGRLVPAASLFLLTKFVSDSCF